MSVKRYLRRHVGAGSVIAAALVVSSAAAHAQLKPEMQTGSLIPARPQTVKPRDAGAIRKGFARCVYRSATNRALALLQHSDPVTVDVAGAKIKSFGKDLDMERCLGSEAKFDELAISIKMPPGTVRDLLAEEAYLANNRTAPALSAPLSPIESRLVSTGNDMIQARSIEAFSDCAIQKDVVRADALLRTMPASDAERNAARALAPALGACLVQGQKFVLSPTSIRAFVAFAMWRRFGPVGVAQ